jgi:hypothetical protein
MDRNLISISIGAYCRHYSAHTERENIMSTLSMHPSAAVQFSAMATSVSRFVRRLFQAAPATPAGSADVWTLYRMTRGADAVSPAVAERLARHAQAR